MASSPSAQNTQTMPNRLPFCRPVVELQCLRTHWTPNNHTMYVSVRYGNILFMNKTHTKKAARHVPASTVDNDNSADIKMMVCERIMRVAYINAVATAINNLSAACSFIDDI